MKKVMTGNEAIARGAFEAGVKVAAAYPGTPSTEILETLATLPGPRCQWSVNEKVALEVGIGASWAGARVLVTMKHVGLNVAADPLFTLSYTGVRGGMVVVTADDPQMFSSQNEQDNRHYARFAKVPMLEPADSQEEEPTTPDRVGASDAQHGMPACPGDVRRHPTAAMLHLSRSRRLWNTKQGLSSREGGLPGMPRTVGRARGRDLRAATTATRLRAAEPHCESGHSCGVGSTLCRLPRGYAEASDRCWRNPDQPRLVCHGRLMHRLPLLDCAWQRDRLGPLLRHGPVPRVSRAIGQSGMRPLSSRQGRGLSSEVLGLHEDPRTTVENHARDGRPRHLQRVSYAW